MSFETTLVDKTNSTPPANTLFWPAGRTRIILIFEIVNADEATVWGIDPDSLDPLVPKLVFYARLKPSQKDLVIDAVTNGGELEQIQPEENELLPSNDNDLAKPSSPVAPTPPAPHRKRVAKTSLVPNNNAIVIIDSTGDGHGPRFYELPVVSQNNNASVAVRKHHGK